MSDWKNTLINIKNQISHSITSLEIVKQHIQNLIDEIDASPHLTPEAIEAKTKSLMLEFGNSLYTQIKNEVSQEIGSVNNQINEIKTSYTNDRQNSSQSELNLPSFNTNQKVALERNPAQLAKNNPDPSLNTSWQKMIELYNQNQSQNYFTNYSVIEVDVTQDNTEMLRTQSNSSVLLYRSSSGRGKFWVVESDGYSYLFPNPRQTFHEHNLDVVRALFDESSYFNNYKKIYLIAPAKIESFESVNAPAWQLIEKGNISFN